MMDKCRNNGSICATNRINYTSWIFILLLISLNVHGLLHSRGHVTKTGHLSAKYTCPPKCMCYANYARADCTAKNLTEIPEGLSPLTAILHLSMNNFTTFPDGAFSHLPQLVQLYIVTSGLTELPANVFAGLTRLESLFLSGNKLKTFPLDALSKLPNLQAIDLYHNNVTEIPDDTFKKLPNLKELQLSANQLTKVPVKAFRHASSITALYIDSNLIEDIPDYAFANLTELVVLTITNNRISQIGNKAFEGLSVLDWLELSNNKLTEIPSAIHVLPDLLSLQISDNFISYIPDDAFRGNRKLSILSLTNNPIKNIGIFAFRNLPQLEELAFSEAKDMTDFPNLSGTNKLKKIILDRASISFISEDLCDNMDMLQVIDVHSNKITTTPRLRNCSNLYQINFGNNEITSLEDLPFKGLDKLKDLILSYNKIQFISDEALQGLGQLQYLDLSHNRITFIHNDAFGSLINLKSLNLAENSFSVLPTKGLKKLRNLKTFHNRELIEPPSKDALPNIVSLALAYAYHCCAFIRKAPETDNQEGAVFNQDVFWLGNPNGTYIDDFANYNNYNQLNDSYSPLYNVNDLLSNNTDNMTGVTGIDERPLILPNDPGGMTYRPPVDCRPKPGPFLPCDDLFGWWSLRCGVWIVFLLAVLGNGAVLIVSISSKSKMDVTRFLICNLAFSDLCMGVYLGFLAIVDASTLGEFEKYAVRWQSSPGCLVAGFLGVLSSELSVFTLVIITLERFYAISHAMQLDKRMTLRHSGYIMIGGWLVCLTIAGLPLFQISDYRKFAICLPFETENNVSLAYVCFIMIFNAISFMVILLSYFGMYLSIRGSHSWNTNDTVVAKRMALLVFTDFFCWAPIIFFSLTAAFKSNMAVVSLDEAKVLTIFVLPLNSCANPFLYAFFTRQFKRDCVKLCRRIEEVGISRHFSTSGVRRVSSASSRQIQNNPFRIKHSNCESIRDNEASGEASNSNSDSDFNVKHLHLTEEEEKILNYVHTDNSHFLEGQKTNRTKSINEDFKRDIYKAGEFLSPPVPISPEKVTFLKSRRHNLGQDRIEELNNDTDADIILHTNQGHVFLNTKRQGSKKCRIRQRVKSKEDTDRCGEKLSRYYKSPPPEQIILTRPTEDQSPTENCNANFEQTDKISQAKDICKVSRRKRLTEKFEADRSVDLGLKVNYYKHKHYKMENPHKEIIFVKGRNIATQTDMNVQFRRGNQIGLPEELDKFERNKHINEWRKTSHLSFLWRNSGSFDAVAQKQKSNSLVELTRPVYDWKGGPNKRHSSLTSRHEGYILLKNGSRDSAYEDDDLYEFREGRKLLVAQTKLKNNTTTKVYTSIPETSAKYSLKPHDFSIESDEICETSVLLPDIRKQDQFKRGKNSCDDESGISSSS